MKKLLLLTIVALYADNINAQWQQVNLPSPYNISPIKCFALSGSNIFVGVYGPFWGAGVFLYSNNSSTWVPVGYHNSGLTNDSVSALTVSGSNIFAGTYGGGVFLSSNNGSSWNAINTGLTNKYVQALANIGSNIFAGAFYGGVFWSPNNGNSWTATGYNTDVKALATSGNNIFQAAGGSGVYLSSNNGGSWTAVNTGLTSFGVYALATSGNNIFVGTANWGGGVGNVFFSSNNGSSWSAVNINLIVPQVNALAIDGINIFAGTDDFGVYFSSNNGSNWTSIGLTTYSISALAISGDTLFAGSDSGRIWKRALSDITTEINETGIINYKLIPEIYPNPATNYITIETPLQAVIEISNIQGQLIKTIAANDKKTSIDISAFPSGIYVVKVKTEKGIAVNKFIKE